MSELENEQRMEEALARIEAAAAAALMALDRELGLYEDGPDPE